MRDFFSDNALYWLQYYHIDGLRCDAVHMAYDTGAIHFWEYLWQKVQEMEQESGRMIHLVAESDLNSPRVIKKPEAGGWGFNALWLDDFHHALYVLLDPKGKERYEDFGAMQNLVKAYTDGFVLTGQYVNFRKKKFGVSSAGISGDHFVVFSHNHDQIGNRVMGERFSMLLDVDRLKIAAAAVLLAPYIPMLFMGEEYAEDVPFYYFISHTEEALIKAVQEGRKKEFGHFKSDVDFPDPQDEQTFLASKLHWEKRKEGKYALIYCWYQKLINIRKKHTALRNFSKDSIAAIPVGEQGFVLSRQSDDGFEYVLCLFNLSEKDMYFNLPAYPFKWTKILDAHDNEWTSEMEKPAMIKYIHAGQEVVIPPLEVAVFVSDIFEKPTLEQ